MSGDESSPLLGLIPFFTAVSFALVRRAARATADRDPHRRGGHMKHLRSFALFWWDFVVGDDWRIAGGAVAALVVAGTPPTAAPRRGGCCRSRWLVLAGSLWRATRRS